MRETQRGAARDRFTGATRPAQILVAVLGASSFSYAEATWIQSRRICARRPVSWQCETYESLQPRTRYPVAPYQAFATPNEIIVADQLGGRLARDFVRTAPQSRTASLKLSFLLWDDTTHCSRTVSSFWWEPLLVH
jgi:hypothetical protein